MKMTRQERVLNAIQRKPVDYLPSHIVFSDRTRIPHIEQALEIEAGTLDEYLDNHMKFAYSRYDLPLHFRNDMELMERIEADGFCSIDRENHIVYDAWGMGIIQYTDGFTPVFFPLNATQTQPAKFMAERLPHGLLTMEPDEAVDAYVPPDTEKPGTYDDLAIAVAEGEREDLLVVAAGYWGTFERSYGLRSFEEFMVDLASEPKRAEKLLDKVTEYKIADAKKKIASGVKVGHHGDDLATQSMTLFSKDMFRRMILPRLKQLFDVYKSAGRLVAMHSCGNITEFIPDLIDIGLDLLEPIQPCMDLKYLKKEFGKDLTFWGGIDTQSILPFGTPEQVRETTREVIHTLGKGGGYIIGPSQEIMNDVPIHNVVAMLEVIMQERERAI